MATLRQQLQLLAKCLGTKLDTSPGGGLPRLARSDSALVQHFRSSVKDDIGIVLCPNDMRGRTASQQHELVRLAGQHYAYWAGASGRRGSGIYSTFYLVTPGGARPIESGTEVHDYAKQLLTKAPSIAPLAELTKRVAGHDWDYSFSDDARVWSAGTANWQRIRELIEQVGAPAAKKVWKKSAPESRAFPG